jgi:hypothetical protein
MFSSAGLPSSLEARVLRLLVERQLWLQPPRAGVVLRRLAPQAPALAEEQLLFP